MSGDTVQEYLKDHCQGDPVEWRHIIDPMDADDGPFQRLAPHISEAVPVAASAVVSTAPDVGYPPVV